MKTLAEFKNHLEQGLTISKRLDDFAIINLECRQSSNTNAGLPVKVVLGDARTNLR